MRDGGVRIELFSPIGQSAIWSFPSETECILVGRDLSWTLQRGDQSEAMVVREGRLSFNAGETRVGRRHLVINRQLAGNWGATPQSDDKGKLYFTAIDGVPLDQPCALKSGAILTLGDYEGPKLRFEVLEGDQDESAGPKTGWQRSVRTWRQAFHQFRQQVIGGFASILMIMGGTTYWLYEQYFNLELRVTDNEERLEVLETEFGREIAEAETRATDQAQAGFSDAFLEKLKNSTHVVAVERRGVLFPIATAWPIATSRIVTNAHVAEQISRLPPSDKVVVCRDGSLRECARITENRRTHPAYAAFQAYLEASGTGQQELDGSFRFTDLPGAYDVAVLDVEAGAQLGAPLEPAEPSDYLNLKVGSQLAFSGYLLRGVDGLLPRVHFGTVSALTDFLMAAPSDGSTTKGQLIHNTIPVTGGASGGAVINSAGKVVAILSSGTTVSIPGTGELSNHAEKAPSAALVNYAQRVDVLQQIDLGAAYDLDAEKRYWDRQTAQFLNYRDYLIRTFLESPSPYDTRRMSKWQQLAQDIEENYDVKQAVFDVEKGRRYAVLAYAGPSAELSLKIAVDGKELTPEPGRASMETFIARQDGTATVTVRSSARAASDFELLVYRSE